jgi:hypothetical protein
VTVQHVLDGTGIEHEAQLEQFAVDLVVSHAGVLTSDADNQRFDVRF